MLAVAGYHSYMVAVDGHMLAGVDLEAPSVDAAVGTGLILYTFPVEVSVPAGFVTDDIPDPVEADSSEITYIPPFPETVPGPTPHIPSQDNVFNPHRIVRAW